MEERPQDAAEASLAPKLTKEDGRVDWRRPAVEVKNLVRGLTPWPGAACALVGQGGRERVLLLRVDADADAPHRAAPGTVLEAGDERGIVVQADAGAVIIQKLKPSSGKAMEVADFLHGRQVRTGDRFE